MPDNKLPPELSDLLARLRSDIQRYVLLEGTASVLVVLGILFWLSLGLDWSYFFLQRAELPRWIRFTIEVAGICTCLVLFAGWVGLRWLRHFRQRALAMVLERRFPELNDRLITAIELTEGHQAPQAVLTQAMLARTIDEAREASRHLDLRTVFDKRPLLRASISASCLLVSVLAFAICFSDVFGLWFRRNVLLANESWKRETAIQLVVLAEPGERVIEFKNGVYKHPRGSDLTLQAAVLPTMKVPEQVQLRYAMSDGSARGRAYFSRLGDRQFKHTLTGLLNSLDCYLLAGDAERTPYHIEVVEPPRIDRIVLDSIFPEYTGWNEIDEKHGTPIPTPKPVQGTQISLPVGTSFHLQAQTNKPLEGVRIQTAGYDLEFTRKVFRLTLFQQDGQTRGGSFELLKCPQMLAEDGRSFSVPFLLATPKDQAIIADDNEPHHVMYGKVRYPLRLPSDAQLKIFLTDTDGIITAEPARLTVNSIADEPPTVETQLRGIGSSITRKAIIPVTGVISDDYGVATARFDYRLDMNDSQPRSFPTEPGGAKKFALEQSTSQKWMRFDVLPLELKIGQKLSLSVIAEDADDLSGPHFAQGEKYSFLIVSDEELLSQLYARELNLRQRFEQILTEVQRTQTELTLGRKTVVEMLDLRKKPQGVERDQQLEVASQNAATAAERGLYGIRKNHNETQAIGQSLGDIREEMINNAVDTPQTLERMDVKLIRPLKGINDIDFPDVDQRLGLFRLALQEQTDPLNRLDESLQALDRLKRKLELVLVEMRKMETYKELLEILKGIKSQQEELKKRTETENKRSIINKLK